MPTTQILKQQKGYSFKHHADCKWKLYNLHQILVIIKKASTQQECTHEVLAGLNPYLGFRVAIYKYTLMYQSNTTKLYYVYYCIRATCFDSYRIIFMILLYGSQGCQASIYILGVRFYGVLLKFKILLLFIQRSSS